MIDLKPLNELKPCKKCIEMCRVLVVQTLSGRYRIGCVMHNEWEEEAYDSIEEAAEAWNRSVVEVKDE